MKTNTHSHNVERLIIDTFKWLYATGGISSVNLPMASWLVGASIISKDDPLVHDALKQQFPREGYTHTLEDVSVDHTRSLKVAIHQTFTDADGLCELSVTYDKVLPFQFPDGITFARTIPVEAKWTWSDSIYQQDLYNNSQTATMMLSYLSIHQPRLAALMEEQSTWSPIRPNSGPKIESVDWAGVAELVKENYLQGTPGTAT